MSLQTTLLNNGKSRMAKKKFNIDQFKLVQVHFEDAMDYDTGWHDLKKVQAAKTEPVTSVGWIVNETEKHIVLSVAKCLKMYWDGSVNTFSRPDLEGIEVKAQLHHSIDPHKTSNFLVVKPNADDELVHVLVLVHSNTRYEVVGFIKGKNAKIKQFERQVNNRPPFYAVPIDELTDMRML